MGVTLPVPAVQGCYVIPITTVCIAEAMPVCSMLAI